MNKLEYFLAALKNGAYKRKQWVIHCFSQFKETEGTWVNDNYPFRLLVINDAYHFVNLESPNEPTRLEGVTTTSPAFSFGEHIDLKAGDVPNLKKDVSTTYGDLLFNYLVLIDAFGSKVDYHEGRVNIKKLESMIESRLVDDVEGENDQDKIYVREFRVFMDNMYQLVGFTQLCVPSASPKTMTRDPNIPDLRKKLLAGNESRFQDPAFIARVDKELEQTDRAWVDDWGKDFYIKDKSYSNVRKKVFLMHGLEKGFTENDPNVLIQNSLSEGWDFTKLPAMCNSLREGSFNRGALTEFGGVATKEAFRAFQNASITDVDCGTTLGKPTLITEDNHSVYVGFYHVVKGQTVEITKDNVRALIGSTIIRRSPMLCKTPYTDYCQTCAGKQLAQTPTALGAATAGVGSIFMGAFMKKMHVSSLSLKKYLFKSSIV